MSHIPKLLLFAALSVASFGCQTDKDEALPTDSALLGRWDMVRYQVSPGVFQPTARLSLEFAADGKLRYYQNDLLVQEVDYQHRAIPKDVESTSGEYYLSAGTGARMYRIVRDTLALHTPYYKGVMNCFPVHERYSRAQNNSASTVAKPQ